MRRVARLIIYTGPDEGVEKVLSRSMPDGTRNGGDGVEIRAITITADVINDVAGVADALDREAAEAR